MGLFRLLILIAIVAMAFWLWRRITRPARRAAPKPGPTPMVRCEQCGVHVPRDHAFTQDQHWYCSQAHLELGRKPGEH